MSNSSKVLSYATRIMPVAPSEALAILSLVFSIGTSAVGVILLLAYWLTHDMRFAEWGFLWLFPGGVIAFVGLLLACAYVGQSKARLPDVPEQRKREIRLLIISILPALVAIVCVVLGNYLVDSFSPDWLND